MEPGKQVIHLFTWCHVTLDVNKSRKFGHSVNHPLPVYELRLRHSVVNNFHCRETLLCSKLTPFLYHMFDYSLSESIFRYRLSINTKNVAGMFQHGIIKLVLRASSDASDQVFSRRLERKLSYKTTFGRKFAHESL